MTVWASIFGFAFLSVNLTLGCHLSFPHTPYRGLYRNRLHETKNYSKYSQLRGPLIWEDDFNFLNFSKWTPMITGWRGSNSFQYYANHSENIYVRNGMLFLRPTLTADRFGSDFLYNGTLDLNLEGCNVNWKNGCIVKAAEDIIQPIQSSRIHTKYSFSFIYGVVEVRAKMPKGDWLWPAIWMAPTYSIYGSNPRSGEIDLAEIRANSNLSCGGKPYGRQTSGTTLHWGTDADHNRHRLTYWQKLLKDTDFSSEFHVFRMEWLPTSFKFFVDDELIGGVSPPEGGFWEMGNFEGENIWRNGTRMAPFDQPFHLILDIAVGGNMFPDWCINSPFDKIIEKPWKTTDRIQMKPFWEKRHEWLPTWSVDTEDSAMQVDYVRVFAPIN